MTGRPIPRGPWLSIMETAHWVPWPVNSQSWRFLGREQHHPGRPDLLDLLMPGAREWAPRAGLVVLVDWGTTHERRGKPARAVEFDTGAAWQNMAREGARRGLVVHAVEGLDHERGVDVAGPPARDR